jgi:hypothetical protein
MDQSRIVPKAALEYVRAATGSLQEFGGLDPVMATGATAERSRILVGAEVGHYWILDQKILDLSAYGKVRRQCFAEFQFGHRQPRCREHHGAGHRRKQIWRRCRRLRVAQPEQYSATLPQL